MGTAETGLITFSAGGVGLVLDLEGPKLPRVLHWGADLGPLDGPRAELLAAALAQDWPAVDRSLIPSQGAGWYGRPALNGHRDGKWLPEIGRAHV